MQQQKASAHSFKGACIDGESFHTRAQGRSTTLDYIECFYNRTRRHSTLHHASPFQYKQLMCYIPSWASTNLGEDQNEDSSRAIELQLEDPFLEELVSRYGLILQRNK